MHDSFSNAPISPENEQFIEDSLESGRYADSAALLNEAISLLKQRDQLVRDVDAGIDQLDRGETVDGNRVFDRLAHRFQGQPRPNQD